jgi:glycosyltransferase involved in cell wall biosynthesis
MKKALVIHPILSTYTGGELLCLHVCRALLQAGYEVTLFSDTNDPAKAELVYPGMGQILARCSHISSLTSHKSIPGIAIIKDFKEIRRNEALFANSHPEVTFCTQSSLLHVPSRLYHFIYSGAELFQYSSGYLPSVFPRQKLPRGYVGAKRTLNNLVKRIFKVEPPNPNWYFAISPGVLERLRGKGHWNSSLLPPPCTQFPPREKRDQIIQVTRLIPEKRVEIFLEAARRLPKYHFVLIARSKPGLEGYARDLQDRMPSNVTLVKASLRQAPHLLEESKIYLYTGREEAMMLTVMEAVSAGCYPIVSRNTGPAETVETIGIGGFFETVDDLVPTIDKAMDQIVNPAEISERARMFSPERFEEKIADIAENGVRSEKDP